MNLQKLRDALCAPGPLSIIAVTLGCWLATQAGVLRMPSGAVYDGIMWLAPKAPESRSAVLLLEVAADRAPLAVDWMRTVRRLEQAGAAHIVFVRPPRHLGADFAGRLGAGEIVLGRGLRRTTSGKGRLQPWPETVPRDVSRWGIANANPGAGGIFRTARYRFPVGEKTHPGLAFAATEADKRVDNQGGHFRINYLLAAQGLPKVTLERVEREGVIRELVNERIVLIGHQRPPEYPTLPTPLTGHQGGISFLEYHGHAINTLHLDASINEAGPVLMLALIAILTLTAHTLFQTISIRAASIWIVSLGFVMATGAWASLVYHDYWLDPVPPLLALVVSFFVVLRTQSTHWDRELRNLVHQSSAQMRERLVVPAFFDSREYWRQLANLVDQTLDIERTIFLETIPGQDRVREVLALNCSIEDIAERRRDYRRDPYASAIKEGGAIRLKTRHLMAPIDQTEEQYLVPLLFGGKVYGFWAFTIRAGNASAIPTFFSTVEAYAEQIAQLLFQRQERQETPSTLQRYLHMRGPHSVQAQLMQTFTSIQRRMETLEATLDGMGTRAILYDLFGRVIQINASMADLLREIGVTPYEQTALDLLTTLAGVDASRGREFLQQITLHPDTTFSLPTQINAANRREVVIHLRPVRAATDSIQSERTAAPFRLLGILVELIDVTEVRNTYRLQRRLLDDLRLRLNQDLQAIRSLHDPADHLRKDAPEAREKKLQSQLESTIKTLDSVSKNLTRDPDTAELVPYPIDAAQPLQEAVSRRLGAANEAAIQIVTEDPTKSGLVISRPGYLTDTLVTILDILINDAAADTQILVRMEQDEHWVHYRFDNEGFGIPQDRLHDFLYSRFPAQSSEFQRLRESIEELLAWGGELTAESSVGQGFSFHIRLQRFL